jgi:predicted DNA-binding transcriptional regulator AlpA
MTRHLPFPARPAEPKPLEELLSVNDLARLFKGSRRTIERMRASGKLPPPDLRVGKLPRWKPETIREWIERGGRP